MNIAIINSCNWGSTGKIAMNLLAAFNNKGHNARFFYGRGDKSKNQYEINFESKASVYLHWFLSRLTGYEGSFSIFATKKIVQLMKRSKTELIILLSPHGHYLNESILFDYVASSKTKLVYIMIDEYASLGKCTNEPNCTTCFSGKGKCPNIKLYPGSWFYDTCQSILERKKNNYLKSSEIMFVGPEFVVNSAKTHYLGKYMNLNILDEAIDVEFYSPKDAEYLKKYHNIIDNQKVILCVSPTDNPAKGAKYFIELANRFSENSNYIFIHIGYRDKITTSLPKNFIPIPYVEDDAKIVEYFSLADVLVCPSLRDTMSNTCLESLSCGTPIIVFRISGMPYLCDESVGRIVDAGNVDELSKAVMQVRKKTSSEILKCRNYALSRYDSRDYAKKILNIVATNH